MYGSKLVTHRGLSFLICKKRMDLEMTCKAPPYFMNGRSVPKRRSDSSRSSIVPLGSLRPTRPGLLPPSRLAGNRGHQAASGSHSVRSPASPRLPSSLKGFCPSPPTSTDHETKTEPKSGDLEERRTDAAQRWARTPRTLRLRHVARKGQLMQSECAHSPPPNPLGEWVANRQRGKAGPPFSKPMEKLVG